MTKQAAPGPWMVLEALSGLYQENNIAVPAGPYNETAAGLPAKPEPGLSAIQNSGDALRRLY